MRLNNACSPYEGVCDIYVFHQYLCILYQLPPPDVELTVSTVCSKCAAIKKNGVLSCCARGGDWFKQCGNNGDKFDHTWKEGIAACSKGKFATESVYLYPIQTKLIFIFHPRQTQWPRSQLPSQLLVLDVPVAVS